MGDIPSNPNGKRSILPIAVLDQRHLAVDIRARAVEDVVRVAVAVEGVIVGVGVGDAVVVGVGVGHFGGLVGIAIDCYGNVKRVKREEKKSEGKRGLYR